MENGSDLDEPMVGKSKSYKKWSTQEMDCLNEILLELVAEGQKSDNGFRSGHLTTCVSRMCTRVPGCTLREVNIRHRIQQWKRVYVNVKHIEGFSGMGYDYTNRTLAKVENDVWRTYVEVHKKVAGYRHKEFPYYPDWKVYFGNDQANGEIGRNADIAFEEMEQETVAVENFLGPQPHVGDYYPDLQGIPNADPPADPNSPQAKETNDEPADITPPRKKAKPWAMKPRKVKPGGESSVQISCIMQQFVDASVGRLGEISKQLSVDDASPSVVPTPKEPVFSDPLKDADEVMTIIESMEELSSIQQMISATRISMNPLYSKMFLRLKPCTRTKFISALLKNQL